MWESLTNLDQNIFLFINGIHSEYWDNFMSTFSGKLVWVPMYAAILVVLLINFNWRTVLLSTLAIALTITLTDQLCGSVLRPYFAELRPSHNPKLTNIVHLVNGRRGGLYGFPSCHAANATALATFVIFFFKRKHLSIFFAAWAITTCYTRMYLGVHDTGDILFGMTIGILSGGVVYGFYRRLLANKWIGDKIYDSDLELIHKPIKIRKPMWIAYTGMITIAIFSVYSFF